jgi:signal transduction histidine kinase
MHALCFSQNSKIDSLRNSLRGSLSSIDQYETLYGLTYELIDVDNNEALKSAIEAKSVAFKLKDSLKIVRASRLEASALRRLDRITEAISVSSNALGIARRNRFNEELKFLLNSTALAYTLRAEYDKALKLHFESLVIREAEGDKPQISIALNNIGLIYFKIRRYEDAIEFYNRSLRLKEEAKDDHDLDRLLINIGLCYNQLSNFNKAIESINSALQICKDRCSDQIKIEAEFGLGVSRYGLKQYDEASSHFLSSIELSKKIDNKRFQAENLVYLGKIDIAKNIDGAEQKLIEAEQLIINTGYNELLIDIYRQLSIFYSQKNRHEQASSFKGKYIVLKDSVYSAQLIENLAKVESNYAERENLATISTKQQIIEQQRYVSILATVVAILSGLLILLIMRVNRITRKLNSKLSEEVYKQTEKLFIAKTKLEKSNRSLRDANDELDNLIYKTSHDLKGPLATLKGICNVALMDVKDEAALDYFLKLDMTSDRLNHVLDRLAVINFLMSAEPASQEIDLTLMIEHILEQEKNIDYKKQIHIETSLETIDGFKSDPVILNHVLESLIDNAFKYHKETLRVESFVKIVVTRELTSKVKIRIIDNGIGLNVPEEADVFRLFFRASERSQTGGTGLFIAKTAARKLQGDVTYNHRERAYTEFEITLPLVLDLVKRESEEPVEAE